MASRHAAITIQTLPDGRTSSSHGTAFVALPTVKNRLVVPAYISLLRPSGSKYIASGGPPECATIVVVPEVSPAASAPAADRGRTITFPPPTNHRPTKAKVIIAITIAMAR